MKIYFIIYILVFVSVTCCTSHMLIPIKTLTPCEWEHTPRKNGEIRVGSSNCYSVTWRDWEIYQVSPSYPNKAYENKIEGYVLIEYCFDTNGTINETEILETEPDGIFDEVVLDAVNKWKINRIDGKPLKKKLCMIQKIMMEMTK